MNEKKLREIVEMKLAPYFDLMPEVKVGDTRKKIDLVIRNKTEPWLVFGIEFKRDEKKTGYKLGQWVAQAKDYSQHTNFVYKPGKIARDNPALYHQSPEVIEGKIPVVLAPPISHTYLEATGQQSHDYNHPHSNVNSFVFSLSRLGELRPRRCTKTNALLGMRIIFNNTTLWRDFRFDHFEGIQVLEPAGLGVEYSDKTTYQRLTK